MSTKIFPMRSMKPPKPIDPEAVAAAEAKARAEKEAEIARQAEKRAQHRQALAEQRERDLQRRVQATIKPELPPKPTYTLPEDWLDCIPKSAVDRGWARKKIRKFLRKNLQKVMIRHNPERTKVILDAAMLEPSLFKIYESWVAAHRETAKEFNIDVSDEEIDRKVLETLGSVLSTIHDGFWRTENERVTNPRRFDSEGYY